MRMEEGQTISLTQLMKENLVEKEFDEFINEEGASALEKEGTMDPKK